MIHLDMLYVIFVYLPDNLNTYIRNYTHGQIIFHQMNVIETLDNWYFEQNISVVDLNERSA